MMQGKLLFSAVTLILFGHIISVPINITTTSAREDSTPAPEPVSQVSRELLVDGSNEMLGDIPIVPDHDVEILNRRYIPLRNCKELLDSGLRKSGLYVVQPGSQGGEFVVYCDMTLLGGGWTIIQRRLNGNLSFFRKYASYQNGFGDLAENMWLGLDKISRLTDLSNTDTPMELYVGLDAFFGYSSFSRYDRFSVGNESTGYVLEVSGFNRSSMAGDSMTFHDGRKFSTIDNDQDEHSTNCASTYKGGWWYKNCHKSNLNGAYYVSGEHYGVQDGLSWKAWVGDRHSLKSTVIAIRPKGV